LPCDPSDWSESIDGAIIIDFPVGRLQSRHMDAIRLCVWILLASFFLVNTRAAPALVAQNELVRNPELVSIDGVSLAPAWQAWEPEWKAARLTVKPTAAGIRCSARGGALAVGGINQVMNGIQGGKSYTLCALCRLSGIPDPSAAVMVRLVWLKDGNPLHPAGVLAGGPSVNGSEARFVESWTAPAEANGARLLLEVKWPGKGVITWKKASLAVSEPPAVRKIKVGTVYLRPNHSTPLRNLELWCEQVDAAGKLGLDIVCLSESILMVGTSAKTSDIAEAIPGPATERLGRAARANHLWLVAGLMERCGDQLFNTAVLINREGKLAGSYRKVHLPREEWRQGITPGADFPVFKTDFGCIGVQICYDYFYPRSTEILALKGAEIVFAPTWGTTFADQDGRVEGQNIFRVRARDNGVYLVGSVYDGDSMVIDPLGRVLASNQGRTGVFWAEIDLNQQEPLWWVGHWRSIGPRDRYPAAYEGMRSPQ
jgi:predicted amidohydrolase